jgi:hypothetical protein
MPYAPTVNDISGQILAQGEINAAQAKAQGILGKAQALYQGTVNAANTRLQGTQALASGISAAGQGIAGGISELGRTFTQNKLISDNVFGKLDAYQQLGLMAPQVADHIAGLNSPQKMAAAMAVYDQFIQNTMQDASAVQRYRAQLQAANDLDRTGQVVTGYDVNGQPITMARTSNAQAQVLQPKAPEIKLIPSEQGWVKYNPQTNQSTAIPNPYTPNQPLKPRQPQGNMLLDPNFQPGGAPGGAGAATPATPAGTSRAAVAPYQVGGKYTMSNGQVLTYIGGPPNDPSSWQ